ncbi:MAG: YggT family protein [Betaproteobacteria bacterium]|jgi:YggT family protein|nr:YggT family protein [Betaproteobacteria bacterium]
MFEQIANLLVQTAFGLIIFLALGRFFMQAVRAPFRNPVGHFVIALTDWAVLPLRRVVPTFRGYDLPSLVFAWIAAFAERAVLFSLAGGGLATGGSLLLVASLFELARACLHLGLFVVIIQVILSWVSPYSPIAPVFDALTRPLYGIFRRFIPPIGNIDLSPLFVVLLIQVLLIALDNAPRMMLTGMH